MTAGHSRCPTAQRYDSMMETVAETYSLLGRNLEPWRAILAVAYWLTDCGVTGLAGRIEALAHDYQKNAAIWKKAI